MAMNFGSEPAPLLPVSDQIGLHCKQLTTGELIELFYNFTTRELPIKNGWEIWKTLQANIVSRKETAGELNIEKPHNTVDETPVIDNTQFVREQDKNEKNRPTPLKRRKKAKSAPAVAAPAVAKPEQKPVVAATIAPVVDKSQIPNPNDK